MQSQRTLPCCVWISIALCPMPSYSTKISRLFLTGFGDIVDIIPTRCRCSISNHHGETQSSVVTTVIPSVPSRLTRRAHRAHLASIWFRAYQARLLDLSIVDRLTGCIVWDPTYLRLPSNHCACIWYVLGIELTVACIEMSNSHCISCNSCPVVCCRVCHTEYRM